MKVVSTLLCSLSFSSSLTALPSDFEVPSFPGERVAQQINKHDGIRVLVFVCYV